MHEMSLITRKLSIHWLLFVFLLAAGLSVRLIDLTDLPLDFHPTRQLVSVIKARGMYYQSRADVPGWQRKFAVQQWHSKAEIEPEIVERLVSFTYRFTGEQIWIGRLYSSLFWLAGAVFLYLLAQRMSSLPGALAAVALYLLLPYAVIASRSFQPDPLMVSLILGFWWSMDRWARTGPQDRMSALGWAALAGLFGGCAILVKYSAAFFIVGGGLGLAFNGIPLRQALRRSGLWLIIGLGILPGLLYLIYGTLFAGFLGQQFGGRFIPSLLVSPTLYLNWSATLTRIFGLMLVPLALLGVFLYRDESARLFLVALWGSYCLYGLFFDYHIWSHDYYNLPLIPIVALSLSPLVDRLAEVLLPAMAGSRLRQLALALILLFGLFGVARDVRTTLKSVDYRPEAEMWSQIGTQLGPQARVIALTQDYGSRLSYWGWLDAVAWPVAGDINYHTDLRGASSDFEARFSGLALKRDFFLVTLPGELKLQPFLERKLAAYPVYRQGDGYVIYDLR